MPGWGSEPRPDVPGQAIIPAKALRLPTLRLAQARYANICPALPRLIVNAVAADALGYHDGSFHMRRLRVSLTSH